MALTAPSPTPRVRRPSLSRSTVPDCAASSHGRRAGTGVSRVPSRICSVETAAAASWPHASCESPQLDELALACEGNDEAELHEAAFFALVRAVAALAVAGFGAAFLAAGLPLRRVRQVLPSRTVSR